MTTPTIPGCPTVPDLCGDTVLTGQNVHRCYLDPDHRLGHVCACWHRWPRRAATMSPTDPRPALALADALYAHVANLTADILDAAGIDPRRLALEPVT